MSDVRPEFHDAVLSAHAIEGMLKRRIAESEIRRVLASGRTEFVREGRVVVTALFASAPPFVLRVFVDVDRSPAVIVTVYRSSKIAEYWRQP